MEVDLTIDLIRQKGTVEENDESERVRKEGRRLLLKVGS